jgi:predicted DNA-binding transcriptional regulator YafY
MLRLLSLLQTHRFWPGPELAGRLDVSARTLRRDIDRLRELGYLVEATRGLDGGYRLEAGADLPPLLLDDEEAVAIAIGLRAAAEGSVGGIDGAALRALAKLEQVLPPRLRRRVNDLDRATVVMPMRGPQVDWSVLTVIAQACRDTVRVQFDYVARDQASTTRVVEPNRLVNAGRRWYLVAWDIDRSDWRTFRVDRIAGTPALLTGFNPRVLPADDAAAFVAQAIESVIPRIEGTVTVLAPLDEVAPGLRWFGARAEAIDASTTRVHLVGESIEWLAACIGLIGHEVTVDGPSELADAVNELAGRMARAARSPTEPRLRS